MSPGNYSCILSKLDRRFIELEIRRSFTVFRLMTILEEAHHSLITPEIDPFLEDLTKNADRAFYFEEGPRAAPRMVSKAASVNAKVPDNSGGLLMMEARAQIR